MAARRATAIASSTSANTQLFHRDGSHLVLQLPIAYSQAALGATIQVPTLDGPDSLTVPAGTQSGEVFRLRRRGMPDPHGGPRGDLLVQTYIEVPKKLNPNQEALAAPVGGIGACGRDTPSAQFPGQTARLLRRNRGRSW